VVSTQSEGRVVSFILAVARAITPIMLGFYGFWLAWRALLPYLPGPRDPDDRVAPFVGYFTDPFINPVAERLHLPARLVSAFAVVVVANTSVLVGRLTSTCPEVAAGRRCGARPWPSVAFAAMPGLRAASTG